MMPKRRTGGVVRQVLHVKRALYLEIFYTYLLRNYGTRHLVNLLFKQDFLFYYPAKY